MRALLAAPAAARPGSTLIRLALGLGVGEEGRQPPWGSLRHSRGRVDAEDTLQHANVQSPQEVVEKERKKGGRKGGRLKGFKHIDTHCTREGSTARQVAVTWIQKLSSCEDYGGFEFSRTFPSTRHAAPTTVWGGAASTPTPFGRVRVSERLATFPPKPRIGKPTLSPAFGVPRPRGPGLGLVHATVFFLFFDERHLWRGSDRAPCHLSFLPEAFWSRIPACRVPCPTPARAHGMPRGHPSAAPPFSARIGLLFWVASWPSTHTQHTHTWLVACDCSHSLRTPTHLYAPFVYPHTQGTKERRSKDAAPERRGVEWRYVWSSTHPPTPSPFHRPRLNPSSFHPPTTPSRLLPQPLRAQGLERQHPEHGGRGGGDHSSHASPRPDLQLARGGGAQHGEKPVGNGARQGL